MMWRIDHPLNQHNISAEPSATVCGQRQTERRVLFLGLRPLEYDGGLNWRAEVVIEYLGEKAEEELWKYYKTIHDHLSCVQISDPLSSQSVSQTHLRERPGEMKRA